MCQDVLEPSLRESSEGSSESSNGSDFDGDGDGDRDRDRDSDSDSDRDSDSDSDSDRGSCSILEDDKFVELPFPPDAESLRDCTARTLPFLYGELQPAMKRAVAKARAACAESGEEYEVRILILILRLRLRLRLISPGEWRGVRGADGPLMAS